jgi:hypothetical protein
VLVASNSRLKTDRLKRPLLSFNLTSTNSHPPKRFPRLVKLL